MPRVGGIGTHERGQQTRVWQKQAQTLPDSQPKSQRVLAGAPSLNHFVSLGKWPMPEWLARAQGLKRGLGEDSHGLARPDPVPRLPRMSGVQGLGRHRAFSHPFVTPMSPARGAGAPVCPAGLPRMELSRLLSPRHPPQRSACGSSRYKLRDFATFLCQSLKGPGSFYSAFFCSKLFTCVIDFHTEKILSCFSKKKKTWPLPLRIQGMPTWTDASREGSRDVWKEHFLGSRGTARVESPSCPQGRSLLFRFV